MQSDIIHQLKFFAVVFAQEAFETFDIPGGAVLGDWLSDRFPGSDFSRVSFSEPLDAPVNGDVLAHFVPKGGGSFNIWDPIPGLNPDPLFKEFLKIVSPVAPKPPAAQQQGSEIEIAALQANQAKYGQTVREAFGRTKIFPDYLTPRRMYYQNLRDHWTEMFLCVGVGDYEVPLSGISFGGTPVVAMGEGALVRVFQPNQIIPVEYRQWWHTAPEVGATATGDGGLPLETVYDATRRAPEGVYLLSGKTVVPRGGQEFPSDWEPGMDVNIRRLSVYESLGSGVLRGNFAGLDVEAGDIVTLAGDYSGDYVVESYDPPETGESISVLTLTGFITDQNSVELSILKKGERFVLTGATTAIITVDRVDSAGVSTWSGWGAGFETQDIEIQLGQGSAQGGWTGPYVATPEGEQADSFEVDILYPKGLIHYDKKGRRQEITASGAIQWRFLGADSWQETPFSLTSATDDSVAQTILIQLPYAGSFEVRARRDPELGWENTREEVKWGALRSRVTNPPARYPDFTTLFVRVKSSSVIGYAANEMLSVDATRILNGLPERRISKAVEYIARSIPVDAAELNRLEQIWTARGDFFDFSFEKPATVKQAVQTALSVGFADFTIDYGVLRPVRDGLIPPELMFVYKQTFSSRNTLPGSMETIYELVNDGQADALDIEYFDSRTWRIETVRCKEPATPDPPRKVEKRQADGITNRDKAFQWGMRQLMSIKHDTIQHKCRTELDGLNCGYGSYVNFVREIPGWSQSSRVKSVAGIVVTAIDRLDWQEGREHVIALRRPDGTMSAIQAAYRIDDKTVQVTTPYDFPITPYETHIFFGVIENFAAPGIIREVRPSGRNVNLTAIGYTPEKYQYDNAMADN